MKRIKNWQLFPTIYSYLLSSIGLVLLLSLLLFTASSLSIFFARNQNNINNLLDRSLAVAWQEYNLFYEKALTLLSPLGSLIGDEKKSSPYMEYISKLLDSQEEIDFWLIVDHQSHLPAQLSKLVYNSWQQKDIITCSEVISLSELSLIDSSLVKKALVEVKDTSGQGLHYFAPVLVQVIVMPLTTKNSSLQRALVVGHILNNDHGTADRYSTKIPGSYLSIGVNGIRVSANIQSPSGSDFVGGIQSGILLKTVQEGKRYIGQAKIEPNEIHFVASDPIRDFEGNIIGALSVGVPSQGLANLKRDTLLSIFISAFVCLSVAMGVASFVARKVATPLVVLSHLAKEISQTESIISDHIDKLEAQPVARIRELWYLQRCFTRMAKTLYQKCQENQAYLAELEKDREELQRLTSELQQVNLSLEKKVEEQTLELRQLIAELKTLNTLKSQFLANMSHELRTPLNSIIGFSEMLYDELYGPLNTTQKEYLEIILSSARHLLQIISDILDLSRIEQGKIALSRQKVSLEELVRSVESIIRPQAENRHLSLFVLLPDKLPMIYVDPTRIKQVLYNLLSNAVKFTPSGGTITITAHYNNQEIAVSVEDTGIGIKEEDQARVFDEFYQAESLYEKKFDGVGLGLPLSKRLVELHGGRIELQSKLGKGTKVTFYLPLHS
ncbi:Signal transduction histidine kinase [Thermanaeromonas toyohensis ToBE]|uniref:Circadian input-output histidine kinase CikA n=1 Tax=Thermanaeromonas toyohensis ToBE TaxID=698762 RepID=A0A1W1W0K3_9FIRM|nr:ATP-binding protein [Thermanaeromonas toyohensis]SMB98644.1 Signal transduction histidine kinase [Thermanaeromonas toyohensis ToBE]